MYEATARRRLAGDHLLEPLANITPSGVQIPFAQAKPYAWSQPIAFLCVPCLTYAASALLSRLTSSYRRYPGAFFDAPIIDEWQFGSRKDWNR
jgi:hypothetical protein